MFRGEKTPKQNTFFFISMARKNVSMARKMWDKIRPEEGSSKLRQPWTDHVYDSFKEKIIHVSLSCLNINKSRLPGEYIFFNLPF